LSKPNGGGYCLKEALGWDDANYRLFQVRHRQKEKYNAMLIDLVEGHT